MPGIAIGLIAAMALFAYNYARVEQVTQFPFGGVYRSNVDRPEHERAALRAAGDRVLILRLHGFIFFGTISSLLERIRRQIERSELRFLVLDLRRTSGLDSSSVVAFRKVTLLASGHGFELVLTGASAPVRRLLERGGATPSDGHVAFEPDLDRGLQRCEDALLRSTEGLPTSTADVAGFPEASRAYAERRSLKVGEVLLHQGDTPDDVYVVESGRLRVELQTPEGTAIRLGTIPPGVTVGEIGLYTGAERTADAVAEEPSVVLCLSRDAIERIEREDPALAIEVHRWLATTIAQRQTTTLHSLDVLMD